MSRDVKIEGVGGPAIDADDILAALAKDARLKRQRRQDAVTCYLSASDGWREASEFLGGAFAAELPGLKAKKEQ